MKSKSFGIKTLIFTLCLGIGLAEAIEKQSWYAAVWTTLWIALCYYRTVSNKWIALRMWACYIFHVVTGVYLTERTMIFFWVMFTTVFICDAYRELTGDHIAALFDASFCDTVVDESEDER